MPRPAASNGKPTIPASRSRSRRDQHHAARRHLWPFTDGDPGEVYENIVFQVVNDDGGHFSPLEVPETIIRDIRATFRSLR